MLCERRGRDEGFETSAPGTAYVGRLVDPGIHVMTEVALTLEMMVARPAVMVKAAVYVVLLPRVVACEVAAAAIA